MQIKIYLKGDDYLLKAALYIRVSTDEQALNGDSITTQKDELTLYAKNNNMTIVDYYIDDGYTATNLKRPNLQRLLKDINNKLVDIVLFTKIDRWSRGVRNYYKIQDTLDKNKVHWKTIFEDYDTSTASGRLHINIMLSVAENESAQTSERIRAVFKNKFEKGEICSGKIPRGYKVVDKKLVIDETTAPLIVDIFNYYEKTNSIHQLLNYIRLKYEHIHYVTLRRILTNPLYTGTHITGIENYCTPIISKEQFNNVQRLLEINQKKYIQKGEKSTYIFSGILKCKYCGNKLSAHRMHKKNKTLGTYIYKYYRCSNYYKEHTCINQYTLAETNILEKYLLDNINKLLKNYITEISIIDKTSLKKANTDLINNIRKKMNKLKELYLDDLIDKETYKCDYQELKLSLEELESANATIPKRNLSALEKFLKLDITTIYKSLTDQEKRQLWVSIIDYIEIGNNRNDITLHFI